MKFFLRTIIYISILFYSTLYATDLTASLDKDSDSGMYDNDKVTNINTPVIIGSTDANIKVNIKNSDAEIIGSTISNSDGDYAITLSQLSDGVQNLNISDESGNSIDISIKIDTKTFAFIDITDSSKDNIINSNELLTSSISGMVEVNSTISITIVDNIGQAVEINDVDILSNGRYIVNDINISSLNDGQITAIITSVDIAGNTIKNKSIIYKDSKIDLILYSMYGTHSVQYISGRVDSDVKNMSMSIFDTDGNIIQTLTPVVSSYIYSDSTVSYSGKTDALKDGSYNVEVIATDNVENNITVKGSFEVHTAQSGIVTIDSITKDNIIDSSEINSTITLTGTATGGDISEDDPVKFTIYETEYNTTVSSDGNWSVDVNGSDLLKNVDLNFRVSVTSEDDENDSVESYSYANYTTKFDLNISDLNTTVQNITAITIDYKDFTYYSSYVLTDKVWFNFDLSTMDDGNSTVFGSSLSRSIYNSDYENIVKLHIVTDSNQSWYYNFKDNNIYSYVYDENDFIFNSDINLTLDINMDSSKWIFAFNSFFPILKDFVYNDNATLYSSNVGYSLYNYKILINGNLDITPIGSFNNLLLENGSIAVNNNINIQDNIISLNSINLLVENNISLDNTSINMNNSSLYVKGDINLTNHSIINLDPISESQIRIDGNIFYDENSSASIDINILDLNLSEYNITSIYAVDTNGSETLISDDISDGSQNLSTNVVYNHDYGIKFTVDDEKNYWYDFSLGTMVDNNDTDLVKHIVNTFNKIDYVMPLYVDINLTNINLSEHNITSIILEDMQVHNLVTFDSKQIQDGNISIRTILKQDTNYMIKFIDDHGMQWYGNFSDGKLYSQASSTSDFLISDHTSIEFDLISSNFRIVYSYHENFDIPNLEFSASLVDYDNATPLDINMSSFYEIEKYGSYYSNTLDITKYIPVITNKLLEIDTEINNYYYVQRADQRVHTIDSTSKILTLKDNNEDVLSAKYIATIDDSELTSAYSSINNSISFPSDSKGYVFIGKQLKTECFIDSFVDMQFSDISDIDTFVSTHTVGSSSNILMYNRYDSTKGIMFDNKTKNGLVEVDITTGEYNLVGTWEVLLNQSCHNYDKDIAENVDSLIKFNIDVDGYEKRSYNLIDGKIYYGEYIPKDDVEKVYFLNDTAAKYLAQFVGFTSIPTIEYPLVDEWTYLSLPTNITLCTEQFKYDVNLSSFCNQNFTIDSIFSNVDKVFKYNSQDLDKWSYFQSNSSDVYEMDKIGYLTHKDGLLVQSSKQTTLHLPYDIFSLMPDYSVPQRDGWFLMGNQFIIDPITLKSIIDSSSKYNMKYIFQFVNNNWKIYAPTNNDSVDSSIPRIDLLHDKEAVWLYLE